MIWLLLACAGGTATVDDTGAAADTGVVDDTYPYQRLSSYGFFDGPLVDLQPAAGVLPYEVAARLWSDGAGKSRFFVLPEGQAATWTEKDAIGMPDGSVVIKSFWFDLDRQAEGGERQHVETRLLVRVDGAWEPHIYVWNEAQTEAFRDVAGSRIDLHLVDEDGAQAVQEYIIPNENQCANCHARDDVLHLLGPDTRQLDRDVEHDGATVNQLDWLVDQGFFTEAPPADRVAFSDPFGDDDLTLRARSYLHANCSHCHRPGGGGGSSGLVLLYEQEDLSDVGVCKTPVAAGAGTGGHAYDIVPGDPDSSIMVYRMESTDPEIKMPELPNLLPDDQGVALIREWISSLEGDCSTE